MHVKSALFTVLTLAVFVMGVAMVSLGFWKHDAPKNSSQPIRARITYNQVYTAADGSRALHAVINRTQVGRDWKEVQTYYDAEGRMSRISRLYAVDERGLVKVDEAKKQLSFISPHHAEHKFPFSEIYVKADPSFIGEGKVLGYRTLVLRDKQNNGGFTEEHLAPALDGIALKHVFNAGSYSTTIEATSVEMGAPSATDMAAEIPDYPVVKKEPVASKGKE